MDWTGSLHVTLEHLVSCSEVEASHKHSAGACGIILSTTTTLATTTFAPGVAPRVTTANATNAKQGCDLVQIAGIDPLASSPASEAAAARVESLRWCRSLDCFPRLHIDETFVTIND